MSIIFGQAGGEVYRSHFMLFFGFLDVYFWTLIDTVFIRFL